MRESMRVDKKTGELGRKLPGEWLDAATSCSSEESFEGSVH